MHIWHTRTNNDKQTTNDKQTNNTLPIWQSKFKFFFFLSIGSFDNHNSQNKNNIKKTFKLDWTTNKQTSFCIYHSFFTFFLVTNFQLIGPMAILLACFSLNPINQANCVHHHHHQQSIIINEFRSDGALFFLFSFFFPIDPITIDGRFFSSFGCLGATFS